MDLANFQLEMSEILSDLATGAVRYPDAVDRMRVLSKQFFEIARKRQGGNSDEQAEIYDLPQVWG